MCWTREEREQFLEPALADEREPVRVDEDAPERAEQPMLEREDERELVHAREIEGGGLSTVPSPRNP